MFNTTKSKKEYTIDTEIEHILSYMAKLSPDSKEYSNCALNLETMYKAKTASGSGKVCWDTVIAAGTGILQVGMIIWHERLNVISSKALGYVFKPRGS